MRPKIIVFASGTSDGGGSGFENLFNATKSGELDAEIIGVVSNHENGGVRERAERLGVPFLYFPGPYNAAGYSSILQKTKTDYVALSGWLKLVQGLDPARTFNIHPALLSQLGGRFGGHGMYGHRIHKAVKEALDAGEIIESGFTMHFVTDEMDRGPAFFEHRIPLAKGMTEEEIGKAINKAEHEWQPKVTNAVVHGQISWDGTDPASLTTLGGDESAPHRE